MSSPSISVVVVNWNSRDDLRDCLAALDAQTDRDFETVVVDNGSTDGSIELVRERFPWVLLVETGENLGFAEGANRGIDRARGAWVALLNNDANADPRWIAELRARARAAGPRLGMLQSRVLFKGRPTHTNSTGVLLFPNGTACDRDFDAEARADDRYEEVFCTTAGAGLYRREMLDAVRLPSGVFDRHYFMYFEDLDLGWRCRLAGWDAFYVPTAVVHHALYGSSKRQGDKFVERHCKRNRIRTLLKNASLRFLVRAAPRTLADIRALAEWDGSRAFADVIAAIRDGVVQRRAVSSLTRRRRRDVEAKWVVRRQ
jgi:GT2 family glycosyltransferase